MEPVTNPRAALIVAHGSPSHPEPAEAAIRVLARRVGRLAPGLSVRGATLAGPGALEAALAGLADPLIYPLFMADGWFVRSALPRRLAEAGHGSAPILAPFGLDPAVWALCRDVALNAARAAGQLPRQTTVLLAAHGSPTNPRPRAVAERAARHIARAGGFGRVVTGYIDHAPRLAEVAGLAPPAICIPFFATRTGHVRRDIPAALSEAGFRGRLLPAIGTSPDAAILVARALLQPRLIGDHATPWTCLGKEMWSQDFGPAVKVDRLTRETIRREEKKEPLARVQSQGSA